MMDLKKKHDVKTDELCGEPDQLPRCWSPTSETGSNFNDVVCLVGGFKYFVCSPLFGEDSHFD